MKNLKTRPKTALPRIYFIDREIAAGKYPNTGKLAKALETGTATISRDIEFLKDRLLAPIEYDFKHKGYYYSDKKFRLPAAFSSAEDIMALGMAKTLLSLYRNTPIYDAAKNLMESVIAPLGNAGNSRWYEDRIIVPPVPTVQFSTEIWQCVCEGLQKNRVLSFEYRTTWKSGYSPRHVRPYQLLFDNGAWYLHAYSKEGRGLRQYSLSRIRNISLEEETFKYRPTSDYRAHLGGSFLGAYSSEKKLRFRIRFFNDGALRVQERTWATDQRIKETKDGVILEFSSTQYGKVLELVLSNGRDALPLEPAELVQDWMDNLRDMRKREMGIITSNNLTQRRKGTKEE
ncbi:MAG: WYL domain-containing protein [Treponema sp.]|jgi:predicted DNA-binding transcriptional regulator YafY|nr:WYL domain-containing protein [Treponema sp.]